MGYIVVIIRFLLPHPALAYSLIRRNLAANLLLEMLNFR
jgi:hypothetical protein